MVERKQILDDPEPCKLRNLGGSECGTCSCQSPADCPNPPRRSPIGMMLDMDIDQWLAKAEEKTNEPR